MTEPQKPMSEDPSFGLPPVATSAGGAQANKPDDAKSARLANYEKLNKQLGYGPDENLAGGVPLAAASEAVFGRGLSAVQRAKGAVGTTGTLVGADLARRGLESVGVPSPVASGLVTLMLGAAGRRGGASAASQENELSSEGKALLNTGKSTSGVPTMNQVRPSQTSGSVVVPEPARVPPSSTSGLPVSKFAAPPSTAPPIQRQSAGRAAAEYLNKMMRDHEALIRSLSGGGS